ncbi:terpene synthase family protein [Annulohypoxylon truncatum]|uniref:terpene synthase family protein n=1 Tax=Annulohypoxylon truncatum TaxID=327061 RepID=UPI002007E486|nr:terpene synthase family protein [Annulohypoxylon truncatum]KAI1213724.1 terpene synthase family protein [Annulohypoxylon truncatum]
MAHHSTETLSRMFTTITHQDLNAQARGLLQRISGRRDPLYGFGGMSCTVYDTAWVSMIAKISHGLKRWLFPESFHYILNAQLEDGGWETTMSQTDGVLNTAASLLSLIKHAREPLQIRQVLDSELRERIERASTALQLQLTKWDVLASSNVGFEMIIPTLLELLEKEGYIFEFGDKAELFRLRAVKLKHFSPELLYGTSKHSLIHSLEAFIGKVDFDQVAHHKVHGSMMASPSSTAAYLMNISTGNDEAEEYLRHVLNASPNGDGGVPSAYPSTYFEYTWIVSTLLKSGFSHSDLECPGFNEIAETVSQAFRNQNAVIGFAPSLNPDVDDTSKGILALSLLDHMDYETVPLDQMISMFEADTHFRTYPRERDPSYSANCHVLLAILHHPNKALYANQIRKISQFLCEQWWTTDGKIRDKWNHACLYPFLLLVEAFTDLLALVDDDTMLDLLDSELQSRVSITLFQSCLRTMLLQKEDGSWEGSVERTAYGILILCAARRLIFFEDIQEAVDSAIKEAIDFMLSAGEATELSDHPWIEKVSYRSPFLTESYVLAALKAFTTPIPRPRIEYRSWDPTIRKQMQPCVHIFKATPLFSDLPDWKIHASLTEALLFRQKLDRLRLQIFPREDMETDKYFALIPFTWTACNNRSFTFASTSLLFKMMIISFLNYQVDEYMEGVIALQLGGSVENARKEIGNLFISDVPDLEKPMDGRLSQFVKHVLADEDVVKASCWDRKHLEQQLRAFLLAHVDQIEDNLSFGTQSDKDIYSSASRTFHNWVHTTSACHTSCPYSLAYLSCLISASLSRGADCFPTTCQKYLAGDACQHLATMCRMYNDIGSIARDREEGNLNSVDFPDFSSTNMTPALEKRSTIDDRKHTLFELAEYEQTALEEALRRLRKEAEMPGIPPAVARAEQRKMAIWDMFVDVTNLYGQIYVVRDMSIRIKPK